MQCQRDPRDIGAGSEWTTRGMKRSPALVELSRRDFCGLACLGIALVGCSNGIGAVQTGALGGGDDDTSSPDAPPIGDGGVIPPHDATGSPDAATGVACTTTMIDVGAASSFVLNMPIYISAARCFIVRDAGGLYAVSAKCTHEGAIMVVVGADYRCPRHGALFKFDGTIVSGPVSVPLVHYAMCNGASGHVSVETSLTVAKTQRLVA